MTPLVPVAYERLYGEARARRASTASEESAAFTLVTVTVRSEVMSYGERHRRYPSSSTPTTISRRHHALRLCYYALLYRKQRPRDLPTSNDQSVTVRRT